MTVAGLALGILETVLPAARERHPGRHGRADRAAARLGEPVHAVRDVVRHGVEQGPALSPPGSGLASPTRTCHDSRRIPSETGARTVRPRARAAGLIPACSPPASEVPFFGRARLGGERGRRVSESADAAGRRASTRASRRAARVRRVHGRAAAGGSTCAAARSAATSAAATRRRASTRAPMPASRATRSCRASSPARTGSGRTPRRLTSRAAPSSPRRMSHPPEQPVPGPAGGVPHDWRLHLN